VQKEAQITRNLALDAFIVIPDYCAVCNAVYGNFNITRILGNPLLPILMSAAG
jgi:hypothetical protein